MREYDRITCTGDQYSINATSNLKLKHAETCNNLQSASKEKLIRLIGANTPRGVVTNELIKL